MLSIAADNYGKNREKQEQRTERERVTIDPEIVFEQQQRNTGGICDLEARREAKEEEGGGAGRKANTRQAEPGRILVPRSTLFSQVVHRLCMPSHTPQIKGKDAELAVLVVVVVVVVVRAISAFCAFQHTIAELNYSDMTNRFPQ